MIGTILTVLLVVLVIALLTAPLEALEWWVDWFEDDPAIAQLLPAAATTSDAPVFIVYLTGVGSLDPDKHAWREEQLFARLQDRLPDAVLVDNILPYSMNNVGLTGQRLFSWLWRISGWAKSKSYAAPVGALVNIRNITQVVVSVDHRYGPIYNRGSAELVQKALRHHGYPFGRGVPIYIIGYSGGAQIATGVIPYLKQWHTGPVHVISLGGVFGSSRGHLQADGFYHLVGSGDGIERLGRVFLPRRWPIWRES